MNTITASLGHEFAVGAVANAVQGRGLTQPRAINPAVAAKQRDDADVLERIAARVEKLGWHVVLYFEMHDLPELEDFFTALPTTVVVDHMGTPDIKKGVDHAENQRFHRLMDRHRNFWVKTTCPERMTLAGPPYDDVVPFGRALVERFPDRVIWGTDWPHPNMKKEAPDDGLLVDYVPKIAATAELQRKLLVDNPMRLY